VIEMTELRAATIECKYWKLRLDEEVNPKLKPSLLMAYRMSKARLDRARKGEGIT